ncbi:MAG: dephospho-CoA kinase [Lachnospiraceae bacterium]|nr:dephospho-CoA kinase [Lachnospiraceae bacterium]
MVIGITGGIGSGKSAVAGILARQYGFTVLSTDDIAKELEQPGHAVYDELVKCFGEGILQEAEAEVTTGGSAAGRPIDKTKFGALIYSDTGAMERAEGIIHPATWGYVEGEIAARPGETVVVETALPDERYRRICDEIWYVYTDEDTRIRRLMASRGYSEAKCRSILAEQITDEEFISFADYIVDNSGTLEEAASRVAEVIDGKNGEAEDRP